MNKKTFRPQSGAVDRAGYPAYGDERGRREFLRKLGLVVAGGALAAANLGCEPQHTGGIADIGKAPLDQGMDTMDAGPDTTLDWPDLPPPDLPPPDLPPPDVSPDQIRKKQRP